MDDSKGHEVVAFDCPTLETTDMVYYNQYGLLYPIWIYPYGHMV